MRALKNKGISKESLLRIPLVREMLSDPKVKLVPRAIDARWNYSRVINVSVSGFNPALGAVFYPAKSVFASWLKRPEASARPLNERDRLVRETLMAVHDYLHVWSYQLIHDLVPNLRFGSGPIHRGNVEDLVFCHILTEAAATVGLDYWYLATLHLWDEVPIGTRVSSITVDYHEDYLREYRRFNPRFNAQTPRFFEEVARFYCDGVFNGFDIQAVKLSPRIRTWLEHELGYGEQQRKYARLFLDHLSGNRIAYRSNELTRPIDWTAHWKKRLMQELGKALWSFVKKGRPVLRTGASFSPSAWHSPSVRRSPDFRFVNLNALDPSIWKNSVPKRESDFFLNQLVSQHDFSEFTPKSAGKIAQLLKDGESDSVIRLLSGKRKIEVQTDEPVDLMILN